MRHSFYAPHPLTHPCMLLTPHPRTLHNLSLAACIIPHSPTAKPPISQCYTPAMHLILIGLTHSSYYTPLNRLCIISPRLMHYPRLAHCETPTRLTRTPYNQSIYSIVISINVQHNVFLRTFPLLPISERFIENKPVQPWPNTLPMQFWFGAYGKQFNCKESPMMASDKFGCNLTDGWYQLLSPWPYRTFDSAQSEASTNNKQYYFAWDIVTILIYLNRFKFLSYRENSLNRFFKGPESIYRFIGIQPYLVWTR